MASLTPAEPAAQPRLHALDAVRAAALLPHWHWAFKYLLINVLCATLLISEAVALRPRRS